MNLIPTQRFHFALLFALGLALIVHLFQGIPKFQTTFQFLLVFDLIVALIFCIDFILTPSKKILFAQRQVSERLSIGRENIVQIIVENLSKRALKCQLRDDYPRDITSTGGDFNFALAANEKKILSYELIPQHKGTYKFGSIYIRFKSRLGFFQKQLFFPATEQVKIYSDLKALSELYLKLGSSSALGDIQRKQKGQGTNFTGLTDYVIGKDVRKIDWKATARTQRPIIREYDREQEQRLLILVDAGRMMVSQLSGLSKFDHALNAALSLSLAALTLNDQVGLGIFAGEPLAYLPPRRGKANMQKFLDVSASILPQVVEPDYVEMLGYFASRQKGRTLLVLLTDLNDSHGSHALLAALTSLRKKHLTFCVLLADERIHEKAYPAKILNDLYHYESILERAVSTDLLSQRQLALDVLQRKGCLVLDATPDKLSSKLIASYLDIKRKALL